MDYAVLSAANSEGGQKMLERNHKLRVGQVGIVGYVAGAGKPRIALDTGSDAIYFNNPDLPETRSEMALPLIQTGGQIVGVLDIQSIEPNAFNPEDSQHIGGSGFHGNCQRPSL
jgi:putative methionine-R-sulfoxide reductase with GAF domain